MRHLAAMRQMFVAVVLVVMLLAVTARCVDGLSPLFSTAQTHVVCDGSHVSCSLADCNLVDYMMWCVCKNAIGTYVVTVADIRDEDTLNETATQCTIKSPCATNAAPICSAIKKGGLYISGIQTQPGLMSAFSWDGWCEGANYDPTHPKVCTTGRWASCMTAPCVESDNGRVQCLCQWFVSDWLLLTSPRQDCTWIKSTFSGDFDMRLLPGAEYVLGACNSSFYNSSE